MDLLKIALNNLRRRKAKAVILAVGIIVAILTTVVLFTVTVAMRENIDAQLDEFGTNLLLTPRYKETQLSYGGVNVSSVNSQPVKELSLRDVDKMRTIKVKDNLNVISPKLVGPIKIGDKTALVVGIQFKDELRIKTWWQYSGKKPKGRQEAVVGKHLAAKRAVAATNYKSNETIAGAVFAKKFNLKPGAALKVKGKVYKVSSVLRATGSSDDNVLFMDLKETQSILGKKNKISFIEANAFCLDCPLEEIAAQLQDKLPHAEVTALMEAMAQKEQTLEIFEKFSWIASVILVLIACLIILVTMTSSVNERTREVGIFRAVGFRQKHILTIILAEAALISGVGGIAGYFAGFGISKVLVPIVAPQAIGFYFNPNVVSPQVLGMALGGALLLGIIGALYPALKAARLDPANALRFI